MVTNMMFNMDMDQQAMRSFMNSRFAQKNNDVNINRMGTTDLLINDQYVDWTSRRQQGPAPGGIIGQQYSRQNEWVEEYESSGASSDTSVTQQPSSKPAPSLPPRPQRPFTEYNVSDVLFAHLDNTFFISI
jgi:hypothetical protein